MFPLLLTLRNLVASCKLFPHTALRQTAGISVHDRLSLCREQAEIQNDITDRLSKILTTIANIRHCSNYTMDIFKSIVTNVNFTNLQYTLTLYIYQLYKQACTWKTTNMKSILVHFKVVFNCNYSQTSMAQTLMARLPRLFRTRS